MAAGCSCPRNGPCPSKMASRSEVGAIAGMDSEFGSIPQRGRQRIQFFVLGFPCLRRVFMTLLQLHVHSFLLGRAPPILAGGLLT